MKQLPRFQNQDKDFQLMQSSWLSVLNPLLKTPIINGSLLKNIDLVMGDNQVVHTLNRPLIGWMISRFNGSFAEIYDNQDTEPSPSVYLALNASADVTVDIWVF